MSCQAEDRGSLLKEAIRDYLLWMIDQGYAQRTWILQECLLRHFSDFIAQRAIAWENIFTMQTLDAFTQQIKLCHAATTVRGLARYLHAHQRIARPLSKPVRELPGLYEEYLAFFASSRQAAAIPELNAIRRVLIALHEFLRKEKIELAAVRIEHLDAVLAGLSAGLAPQTRRHNRGWLRGFLRYLHQVRGVLPRDLAALVVGAPRYGLAKPPKFLRPQELRQLFAGHDQATPRELRTQAMLWLAYALGLRPKEISSIGLDDISFTRAEISLRERKCQNPIRLPLPEAAIKAIAAYVIGARPKATHRRLFLGLHAPYNPVSPAMVSHALTSRMRAAGICASAYWLRHTYAQNLLETGTSIFEIKQMMGHDCIQTTQRYLHIHTKLMREVLFAETL